MTFSNVKPVDGGPARGGEIPGTPAFVNARDAAAAPAPAAPGLDPNACTCAASYLPHKHTDKGIEVVS